MARGFESKSVADQQESALESPKQRGEPSQPRRRTLELARADVVRRLEGASDERYREMLRRSLAALEKELGKPS